jgi:hypothetical protein
MVNLCVHKNSSIHLVFSLIPLHSSESDPNRRLSTFVWLISGKFKLGTFQYGWAGHRPVRTTFGLRQLRSISSPSSRTIGAILNKKTENERANLIGEVAAACYKTSVQSRLSVPDKTWEYVHHHDSLVPMERNVRWTCVVLNLSSKMFASWLQSHHDRSHNV